MPDLPPTPPADPPSEASRGDWEHYAIKFLRAHFAEATTAQFDASSFYADSPLEGEGAIAIFRFHADRADRGPAPYYVAVGRTEPNYYDATGLDFDDAFALHLGTRFMLALSVAQVHESADAPAADAEPYDLLRDARRIVDRVAPEAPLEDVSLAALFDVAGARHAVIRARIAGTPVYIMGRDAPIGFSERTDLAAPVAYRIHLGHVLRMEPDPQHAHEHETG